VRTGQVSATAQRVAARRLRFERVASAFGDPAADDRLAADVAGQAPVPPDARMEAYLRARTAFFDRVVVDGLERGTPQVVIVAAGYDGRALRYARPGVRWFEVDHPATQQDKRQRLARLGIACGHITFVPVDLAVHDVAAVLAAAGHDRSEPSLLCCEGLAVYLDRAVLASLLERLRSVAAAGTRLAISLSVSAPAEHRAIRQSFQATVAALGEPARTVLTPHETDDLLAATGWRVVPSPPAHPPAQRLGPVRLLVLEPLAGS
jgi:methyltransferase (TIGR00027 family)